MKRKEREERRREVGRKEGMKRKERGKGTGGDEKRTREREEDRRRG